MAWRVAFFSGYMIFALAMACSAQQNETLTIATYYPSPSGVYQTVRLNPSAGPGDCNGVAPPLGKMYFDSVNNALYVCTLNAGNPAYQLVPGGNAAWGTAGNHMYVLNTTMNVGIGMTAPTAKLEVTGTVKISTAAQAHKVVCVRADGILGFCNPLAATGVCTCTGTL